jgi:WD40 repeat protein
MGKSSLMHRTSVRLRDAGIIAILLDLTGVGANLSAEQWYFGLLAEIGKQVALKSQLESYWNSNSQHGPLYKFVHALTDIILESVEAQITIFIDEIDFIRGLKNFSTDEFFAAIRQCFNGRASDPRLRRLTFCLLGVATPADLIRDVNTTPFNIGVQIELADFTDSEAETLRARLDTDPLLAKKKLDRILHWTGGHPYLTQKLCVSMAEHPGSGPELVDKFCHEMFLATGVRRKEDNLIFVHNTLRNGREDAYPVLLMYRKVLSNQRVPNDPSDPVVALLRLAGVVRVKNGRLVVRNVIYAKVFDKSWVTENMPDAALRIERRAYFRALLQTGTIALVIVVAIAFFAVEAFLQKDLAQRNEITAKNYLYVADMNLAQEAYNNIDTTAVNDLLTTHEHDPNCTSFDWDWLNSKVNGGRYSTLTSPVEAHCASFSPDGSIFVEGLFDGTIEIWKRPFNQQKPVIVPTNANDLIESLAFCGKSKELVLLTYTGKIFVMDTRSWQITDQWNVSQDKAHPHPLCTHVAVSSDGSLIAVSGVFGVRTFGRTRFPIHTYPTDLPTGAGSVAISHDGHALAMDSGSGKVLVINLTTGKSLPLQSGHGSNFSIAFSPNDETIATGSSDGFCGLWDSKSGVSLQTMQHNGDVHSVAFSPDGQRLYTGSSDDSVHEWDANTGAQLDLFVGHSGAVSSVCASPDNRLMASVSGPQTIFRLTSSTTSTTLKIVDGDPTHSPDPPSTFVFSNNGDSIASADIPGHVIVWSAVTGARVHYLTFTGSGAQSKAIPPSAYSYPGGRVTFLDNDNYLLVGTVGKALSVYDIGQPKITTLARTTALQVDAPYLASPDGRFLVASYLSADRLELWDIKAEKLLLSQPTSTLCRLIAISRDGSRIAILVGTTVVVYDTKTLQPIGPTLQLAKGLEPAGAFSADGNDLLVGTDTGPINCWNLATGRLTIVIPGESPLAAMWFQPDGKMMRWITLDNVVHTWRSTSE